LKKRFGVSIPVEVAEDLDKLAGKLGTDRSSLVVEALKTFLHDNLYILKEHVCTGILVSSNVGGEVIPGEIIEKYRGIIKAYNHYHVGNLCIVTIIVSGPSEKILGLASELSSRGCRVRYIPLTSQ
jgi:CopG family nickel-responsive transcriptional regulator